MTKKTEYVLVLGEVHAEFLPERSTHPMDRPLKKPLKELLLAARTENVSTIYRWKNYGTDHDYYYPILIAGVHSIPQNPKAQLEEIISKTNAAAIKHNLKLSDGIWIYCTPKLQIEPPNEHLVGSVGNGRFDGHDWDEDQFPATPEEIPQYASKLLNLFKVYLKVRHKELEKSIIGCEQKLCQINRQGHAQAAMLK
jgi:hypothetical protein